MDQSFQPVKTVTDFGNGWLAGSLPPTSNLVGAFYFQGNGTVWIKQGLSWVVFGSLAGPQGPPGVPGQPQLSFILPTMTTGQKNAIASPPAGMLIFDITLAKACVYVGSGWQTITSA